MAMDKPSVTPEELQTSLDLAKLQAEPVRGVMMRSIQESLVKAGLSFKIEDYKLIEVGDSTQAWLNRLVTVNPYMQSLKEDIRKLAEVQEEVLIAGPTGTGKELIAQALHGQKTGKFIPVNCAGLPENLVESLIFGHKKGSFTGADTSRIGAMTAAKNGTFFLDEVGELKLQSQGTFLRALQSRKITPIGATEQEDISCRIVCATNKDLKQMCSAGMFRLDLYARLSTIELDTIGLDDRREDIRPILLSLEGGKEFIEAMNKTDKGTDFPYHLDVSLNVRSLQQHVKRYKVLGRLPK